MAKNNTTKKQEIVLNGALLDKTYHDAEAVNAIKDSRLKGFVKSYITEEGKGQKAAWKMVRLIGQMTDVIKKDFGSDAEFAAFMGMTQSAVNKRKRIAKYADKLEAAGYTVTNAFELLPAIGKIGTVEHAENFIDSVDAAEATQAELREVVKSVEIKDANVVSYTPLTRVQEAKKAEKKAKEEEAKKAKQAPKSKAKSQPKQINATYIKYTLPWLEEGQLIDKNIELSEADAKTLAKALMKLLKEDRV